MNDPTSNRDPSRVSFVRGVLLVAIAIALAATQAAPAVGLVAGIALALVLPAEKKVAGATKTAGKWLLSASIAALGAGMDLRVVAKAGLAGLGYTAFGIAATLLLGTWLGRRLRVESTAALLVSVGTAICGGSAIAAVAPAIRARDGETSMALAVVFLLNAVALFVFPPIGHFFGLSEHAFGLWSALAIHDTSSVVGAATAYGPEALGVATTAKLARALWIVPVTLVLGALQRRKLADVPNFQTDKSNSKSGAPPAATKPSFPLFILAFVAVSGLTTALPALQKYAPFAVSVAHRGFTLALFAVGLGLSRATLRTVGIRPLLQGVILWFVMASLTLIALLVLRAR